MTIRDIVQIDEEKCDGCGLCVPSCEEGAIQVIEGKARVVSDTYCDGLGACLGHCPRGAILIVQREAAPFDLQGVAEHLASARATANSSSLKSVDSCPSTGCPGTVAQQLQPNTDSGSRSPTGDCSAKESSRLANWPVQLHLISPQSPLLRRANLLLVADCVPLACASFHAHFLDGRPVVIGCPKLDDCHAYVDKLAAILQHAQIQSISVVHMEVPCCTGLLRVAESAMQLSGIRVPMSDTVVTTRGEVIDESRARALSGPANQSVSAVSQLPIL